MRFVLTAMGGIALCLSGVAIAHPGGLNASGCHNDRRNGGYHCHRGDGGTARSPAAPRRLASDVYFANCAAARAEGAAPVRRGDPGYASHLDRDNDGVACE